LIFILLGAMGSLKFAWYYGVGKPYAYQEVDSLSGWLLSHSSVRNPLTLAGDAYYTANMFFILSLSDKFGTVVPEPLGRDAVTLYESIHSHDAQKLIQNMHTRNIKCLLIVRGTNAIWGDEWGYAVTLPSTDFLKGSLSVIYDDDRAQLLCTIHSES